ncbi:MAG: ATP-dependent metallopeptidase FtsH/Yme1/Tma family protein [Candidatus Tectomicrobia bacterium]|uniref:ATP-dependent zinc metalloprotease FtsH n=1 Tax=Tectimicrobiota bacterium TaxID=2528274 RepID=A0A932M0K2_UNCTE|nr:ATP-dependent metallopeptidase FtsH/Yme1/Tma family protein [Candidatus Tectomicrobia bacterium]
MEKKQQSFSLWYFLIAFFFVLLLQNYLFTPRVANLTYSEFKELVRRGLVKEVVIEQEVIRGELKMENLEGVLPPKKVEEFGKMGEGDRRFFSVRVEDPGLIGDLEEAEVKFTGVRINTWFRTILSWVLPALIFVGIWVLLMRRFSAGSGLMAIGKSKAKVYVEKETGVTFADVAGVDEAKEEVQEIVELLKNPQRYGRLGGKNPKGVLLVGVPGTGKTLLARAIAGEAGVPFFSMSGSSFVEMFVGVGAARVRDLFAQAQASAPCIIFIDELDALGKARSAGPTLGGHDEREQTLNQLLTEMDGFDPRKGVIILAATNRPEILDPALLRAGRFDRHVLVDRPDINGREAILKVHAKGAKLASEVNLREIAAKTVGFVGADLANLVNEAALLAARRDKEAIDMKDFSEAIDRIVAGLEKKNRLLNPREREVVAYHEAGHALIATALPGADPVSKISIIPRGIAALGYTQQLPTEDRYLMLQSELETRISVLLGGRVAEEIIFEDVSTGAQNDLQRVSDIARRMVTDYGMSKELGLISYDNRSQHSFLPMVSPGVREYSEDTAQRIDQAVARIVAEAHDRVKQLLQERRGKLETLAKTLLDREVLEGKDLEEILRMSA